MTETLIPAAPEPESAVVQAWRKWREGNDDAGRGAAFAGGWQAARAVVGQPDPVCGFPSSVTDRRCDLPPGHPMWDATRFHRFRLGPAGWLRNYLRVAPVSETDRDDMNALLDAVLAECHATPLPPGPPR